MKTHLEHIPRLGSGIGYRPELHRFIFDNKDKIDFLEIIADHYIDVPDQKLRELEHLKAHFPLIPHGIDLSLGSAEGLDKNYLRKLAGLIRFLDPPYWSEHISYTRAHGEDIGHLSPILYNEAVLNILETNLGELRQFISTPLILENITYHIDLPGRTLRDADFLNRLCASTGCGLLLDITNLYINGRNLGIDPQNFLEELDPSLIVQLHYVGYLEGKSQVIDTHSQATQDVIFQLMEQVLKRHLPKSILLERDDRYVHTDEISQDLERARQLYQRYA